MPAPAAPFKTALGLEELQLRTRRLGQRYRTVLLLVDGRRPLGEVLAMALSAGADTSHFEELVRLGLVEVPAQSMAPEPRDSGPIPLDVPTLTSVAFDVPEVPAPAAAPSQGAHPILPPSPITVLSRDEDAPAVQVEPIRITTAPEPPPPAQSRRKRTAAERASRVEPMLLRELADVPPEAQSDTGPDTVANPEVDPIAEADAPAIPAPVPAAAPAPAPSPPPPRPAPPPAPSLQRAVVIPKVQRARAPQPAQSDAPPLMTEAVVPPKRGKKPRVKEATETAFQVADHARPRKVTSDEKLHHQVRSLLMGAMGAEAALFSPMTLARLRNAQTQKDLISLVWEIERQRSHVNRSRAQMFSLERARDLLGMGNTVVAGDSQADTTWPDTQGGD